MTKNRMIRQVLSQLTRNKQIWYQNNLWYLSKKRKKLNKEIWDLEAKKEAEIKKDLETRFNKKT